MAEQSTPRGLRCQEGLAEIKAQTIIIKVRTMLVGCTDLKCVFGQKMCKCVGKTAGKPTAENVDNALHWLVFVLLQPVHIVGL